MDGQTKVFKKLTVVIGPDCDVISSQKWTSYLIHVPKWFIQKLFTFWYYNLHFCTGPQYL